MREGGREGMVSEKRRGRVQRKCLLPSCLGRGGGREGGRIDNVMVGGGKEGKRER